MRRGALLAFSAACVAIAAVSRADPAPFDLAGPSLAIRVSRGATTLPISEVPNLAAGDRLWIKAELPASQTVHYLMVAAFLSGSTNPPQTDRFFRCDTWRKPCSVAGLTVTVPDGAQQVLLFLAPETGGDYRTLINAVRGRPGAFVRTSQDLNQAMLDRSRLGRYLAALGVLKDADNVKLKQTALLLARSLAIKVDEKCLDRIPELQAACLIQGRESLILNDGHSTSMVEALTSGPVTDLAMEASYTPQLNYGYYSPYLASVLDIARILDSFHTAQYQYIPALATTRGDRLTLTLNTPPSFYNPKSVLVAALPAVEPAQFPPLHAVDPAGFYCARKAALVLPVEGAPLVFSAGFAHDMVLSLSGADGRRVDLPARADPTQGGFVVDTSGLDARLGDHIQGSIHGHWGFDDYRGPSFRLVNAKAQTWQLGGGEAASVIVGREDVVHLRADTVSCIDHIMLKDPAGKEIVTEWRAVKPDELELKLPLNAEQPGPMTLLVSQYGENHPESVPVIAFSEAGRLNSFVVHAGDSQGLLKGNRLDEVAGLAMHGIEFVPATLTSRQGQDELLMVAQDAQAAHSLKQEGKILAKVTLRDGRVNSVAATVLDPRPSIALIGKSIEPVVGRADHHIQLENENELPQDAKVTFSVRAVQPSKISSDEQIEVATADGPFSTMLSFADGGIRLQNAAVAVARFDPAKAFGPSAFGPLQIRIIAAGVAGDWLPLGTLVRLPVLKDITCPATPDVACKLSGADLFLVDSVAGDAQFGHPTAVPDGFPGDAMPVPRPVTGPIYVRLRDDPSTANPVTLPISTLRPSAEDAERAMSRLNAIPLEDSSASSKIGEPQLPTADGGQGPSADSDAAAAGSAAPEQPAPSGAPPPAGPPPVPSGRESAPLRQNQPNAQHSG